MSKNNTITVKETVPQNINQVVAIDPIIWIINTY